MVAEFQMDGLFSDETFLNHTGLGDENMTELTFCLRYNINYFRGSWHCLLSFSSRMTDNTLSLCFWRKENQTALKFYKYIDSTERNQPFLSYVVGVRQHQTWHHVCVIIKSLKDQILMQTKDPSRKKLQGEKTTV